MAGTTASAGLERLAPGSHVCWIVDDDRTYLEVAAGLLTRAAAAGEKGILFGPAGSRPLIELAPLAAATVDPHVAVLGGGRFDPEAMFTMFREQAALARAEGFRRLRVVADMDWLLPAEPTTAAIVGFELLLDRRVKELDATIVCAYRSESFDTAALAGAPCVHPIDVGNVVQPQFRLVAEDARTWRLSGEVDVVEQAHFGAAIAAAAGPGACRVNVSDLDFIDVAGMRAIAQAARSAATSIVLVGARPALRRSWVLAGFDQAAPTVELAS